MPCIINCPICNPNTVVFIGISNVVTSLIDLFRALEQRANARRHTNAGRFIFGFMEEAERWQNHFNVTNNNSGN